MGEGETDNTTEKRRSKKVKINKENETMQMKEQNIGRLREQREKKREMERGGAYKFETGKLQRWGTRIRQPATNKDVLDCLRETDKTC